jgi:hypothetical protein
VSTLAATVHYHFGCLHGGDLIFAMYYVTADKKQVLVPQRLFDMDLDAAYTSGTFSLKGPGTLYLRWANTHSWFGEKILNYSVDVVEVGRWVLTD